MAPLLSRARAAAASAGGAVLAGATRVVALRPAAKPLHPRGRVLPARLTRAGGGERTGVAWLDEPGADEVLVRRSRAIGLPDPLPDIHGLAIRVPLATGHADLLLASTGLGRVTRFTLTGGRSPDSRPMTTLLPYRSPTGPVLLAAVPRDAGGFHLAWARPGGPWHRFGELVPGDPGPAGDALVSFDPVRNPVPGLDTYDWVRRLREPAYGTARHSR